ncbi:MAG: toll/interleukin-1 receptor domain-containing protein [Euryarchaeota archaeon]|nr:toll/interleukin-1 receptor domain-containing protein [Euryarchaeota archaeon]
MGISLLQGYLAQIQGVSVFLSESSLIIGQLSKALITKIRECDLFIVLYSKNSQSSTYVQQEIGVAKGNNKIIIPILLDADARPDAMLQGVSYLSIYDEEKRNRQLPLLYNYILQESQRKNASQALLVLGVIILLGYALFRDR